MKNEVMEAGYEAGIGRKWLRIMLVLIVNLQVNCWGLVG
jgi:hypothetical protein